MGERFKDRDEIGKATYNPREFRHTWQLPQDQRVRANESRGPGAWAIIFICCAVVATFSLRWLPAKFIGIAKPSALAPRSSISPIQQPVVSPSSEIRGSAFENAWLQTIGTVPRCQSFRQRVHEMGSRPGSPTPGEVEALWKDVKKSACNMTK